MFHNQIVVSSAMVIKIDDREDEEKTAPNGSGAVAGTIRIIHNQPDPSKFTAEISADGSTTSHAANGSYTVDGIINIPISDTAALRVNGGYKTISGFIDAHNAVVFD